MFGKDAVIKETLVGMRVWRVGRDGRLALMIDKRMVQRLPADGYVHRHNAGP